MYRQILVAFDGSMLSSGALSYAGWIARKLGATVHVVTVAPSKAEILRELDRDADIDDMGGSYLPYANEEALDKASGEVRQHADSAAKEAVSVLRESGVQEVDATVPQGDPAEEILAAADKLADGLVVMATHGRSGIQRWALGSVADKVVRHCSTPVFVVRAHEGGAASAPKVDGVLVPLDGSELSERAAVPAAALAKAFDLPITLIRAVPSLGTGHSFVDVDKSYQELIPTVERAAQEYLDAEADQLRGQGVRVVDAHLADMAPEEMILKASPDRLIVMSSHGRSGIARWTLGSVADRVITHSVGPVLLVR